MSYAARLETRLGMEPGYLWSMARREERRAGSGGISQDAVGQRLAAIVEEMTGFRMSSFLPVQVHGLAWHACRECTSGPVVQLAASNGQLLCREHRRWIGPSVVNVKPKPGLLTSPDGYHSRLVGDEVYQADILLEKMITSDRASQKLIDELWARIASSKRRRYMGTPTPSDLPLTVALLSILTDEGLAKRLFDPMKTFNQAHSMLGEAITGRIPRVSWAVIDEIWLMLRPSFVWYRTTKLGQQAIAPFEPLVLPDLEPMTTTFPLEPMSRYLDCLSPAGRTDDQWWFDRFVVPQADPEASELLICGNGHVQKARRGVARRAGRENFHCTICTGGRVIPGVNSLADLRPELALEWDQEANGILTPQMVSPGSNRKVGWKDSLGHTYKAYITNRTARGTGCPFCASKAVLPGFNDLATTHPDLAAMWDYEANGQLRPSDVSAGNHVTSINFRCQRGHPFTRTPAKLVESGGRCQKCRGRILIPGTNDLASKRPDIAAWWHPTKNRLLAPEQVKPGSERRVWWLCPDGHEFERTPSYMCQKNTPICPADTGRMLLPGFNDLATREPELVKDWDFQRNAFGPDEVVPGAKHYSWTCRHGHTQEASVVNRRRAGGCTRCPPEDRAAAGQRKGTRGRQGWDKRLPP